MTNTDRSRVTRREDQFAKKIVTKIWSETPSTKNPYIAESSHCHGYDLLELMAKRSYPDLVFLLFKGELPTPQESQLMERLMIAFINPGPRHPATRAAMNAGVGKTDPSHILPIGLTILGGEHLGAAEVEPAIRWLRKQAKRDPHTTAEELIKAHSDKEEGDLHIAPGFGSHFGGVDQMVVRIARQLITLPGAGKIMQWADAFSRALEQHNMGWLSTGLVGAVLADLGFQPRMGGGIFQIMSAPGLFAHGIEMASKPLTAMPFPDDKDYFIETGEEKNQ
ncbi:MAG: citrate synthase [Cellvibrionaceae bacterium]